MLRYIAFAWNSANQHRSAAASALKRRVEEALPDWHTALSALGISVHHSTPSKASKVHQLTQDRGVVLGTLFGINRASTGSASVALDERATSMLCETEAMSLIENYWGRYIAFIRPANDLGVWVVRDPTAGLPCFRTEFEGIDVIFSTMEDCSALGLIEGGINRDHIASYLWFDHMITSHTGLAGVYQVQAGERILVGANKGSSRYIWNPVDVCQRRTIEDRRNAAQALGSAIRTSVEAWASRFDKVLLELSGGLDSAIVLSCLARMREGPAIVCENHFSRELGGDERHFARKAASSAAVELVETPILSSGRPIQSMFNTAKVASPAMISLVPDTQSRRQEIVESRSIEAIFSGQGGDHLFQSIKTPEIAAEYAFRHGVDTDLMRITVETARLTRLSFWSVLSSVLVSGILRKSADPYVAIKPSFLLTAATAESLRRDLISHPWVALAGSLPGSKRRQVFDILDTQNFQRPSGTQADVVHPLISQPIIEICLQIPSYVLTYDGKERALVRDIFRTSLPYEIVNRTTKGATTGYFTDVLVNSAPSLREFLLDGLLVSDRFLSKATVEAALTDASLVRGADLLFPVLDAVRAELWLRSWSSAGRRRVP